MVIATRRLARFTATDLGAGENRGTLRPGTGMHETADRTLRFEARTEPAFAGASTLSWTARGSATGSCVSRSSGPGRLNPLPGDPESDQCGKPARLPDDIV